MHMGSPMILPVPKIHTVQVYNLLMDLLNDSQMHTHIQSNKHTHTYTLTFDQTYTQANRHTHTQYFYERFTADPKYFDY